MMEYKILVLKGYSTGLDEIAINRWAEDGWMVVTSYKLHRQVHIVMGKPTE